MKCGSLILTPPPRNLHGEIHISLPFYCAVRGSMVKDWQSSTGVERLATNMPADWVAHRPTCWERPQPTTRQWRTSSDSRPSAASLPAPPASLRTHAASNGKDPEKSAGAVLWPEGLTVDITTAASNTNLPLRVPLWKRQEPHEGQHEFVDNGDVLVLRLFHAAVLCRSKVFFFLWPTGHGPTLRARGRKALAHRRGTGKTTSACSS